MNPITEPECVRPKAIDDDLQELVRAVAKIEGGPAFRNGHRQVLLALREALRSVEHLLSFQCYVKG